MPRILVADDNTNIQKMVALAFHDRGIDVTAVGNGEAAVRRMSDLNPDLILADIFMPVRNGYEVCEWVKKDPKYSHIPVILLVGAFDPLDEKEARRVGADGVLKKPFIPPDPLIAMVTSVLEKNSKLSPEIARPKQSIVVPPPPVPVVAVPAQIEAEPVAAFPEPSPEEDASLAYGFGSGRRALDDEANEEPAPIAETDKEPEEEFEGASTTKDWRRSAMEFEIPEEASRQPAFSSVEDLEPTFPSEKDVPPRHIPIPDAVEEIEPVAQKSLEPEEPSVPPLVVAEVESVAGIAVEPAKAPQISLSEPTMPAVAEVASDQTAETEVHEAPVVETQAAPEPSLASKAAHWMDLMASPSEQPRGNWFTSIFGSRARAEKKENRGEPAASAPAVLEKSETPLAELKSAAEIAPELKTTEVTVAQEIVEVALPEEEPFFADEPGTSGTKVEAVVAEATEELTASNEAEIETEAPKGAETQSQPEAREATVEESAGEIAAESIPEPVATIPADASIELISEASDEPTLAKEPDLVEPPAVHVTPEPLLVDESPRASVTYAVREQETAPLYSFLSALPPAPAPAEESEEPVAARAVGDHLIADQAIAEESTADHAAGNNWIDDQPPAEDFSAEEDDHRCALEFSPPEFDETETTVPLPSREALAHIPFLNPPPAFHESNLSADSEDSQSAGSATVDAVVQKLLERIEPQLRDLLSQNVLKPLVENLLQNELEKKSR